MKKILALILVCCMLVSALALVSCGNETADTTTAPTTVATTEATTEPTTEATTEPTTIVTTEATTVATTEPTTEATTTVATTEATTTEATSGTFRPLFARFDFGTESYAVENNLSDHQFLLSILSYDKNSISIDFLEDSWKITALKNYAQGGTFSLSFEGVVSWDYEFDDNDLSGGFGSWAGYPYTEAYVGVDGKWCGKHQYMRIRYKNLSNNNMISFQFHNESESSFYTTTVVSNMYLQGEAGVKGCKSSDEWHIGTYDVLMLSCLASCRPKTYTDENGNSVDFATLSGRITYNQFIELNAKYLLVGNNNWGWMGSKCITGLCFHLLGAYSANNGGICDSRTNIKAGASIEVDYIIFGSTPEQLDTYKSNMERAAA